ncbi:hypothetical protein QU755_17550 [Pseudomonas wenzhouensis]|nr:hypothetical protein [Pseudomonas wenzhouensis]MDM9653220.1 hypothetical protein [Pseudomonas wenzhouensis]
MPLINSFVEVLDEEGCVAFAIDAEIIVAANDTDPRALKQLATEIAVG